jgi:MoxR-like ATPase/HEAT repeat protein
LGFLITNGYTEKEAFLKSIKYAFVNAGEQEETAREMIESIMPGLIFRSGASFPEGKIVSAFVPSDLNSIMDILIKTTSSSHLERVFKALKKLVSSKDEAYVRIPGLGMCFEILDEKLIREVIIEELEGRMEYGNRPVRLSAIKTLVPIYISLIRQGKEINWGRLEKKVDDRFIDVHSSAVQALSLIWHELYRQGKITFGELEARMEYETPALRKAAIQTLSRICPTRVNQGEKVSLRKLEENLDDKDRAIRKEAIQASIDAYLALLAQGQSADISKLERRLTDEDHEIRKEALHALTKIYCARINYGQEVDLYRLEERLKDEDWDVRDAAAQALGHVYRALMSRGIDVDVDKLEEKLKGEDWFAVKLAVQILTPIWSEAYMQGKITVEELENKIENDQWPVRSAVVNVLASIYPVLINRREDISLERLEEKLKSDVWDVRHTAAGALSIIWSEACKHGKITVKILEEKLGDKDPLVRQTAIKALAQIYALLSKTYRHEILTKLGEKLGDEFGDVYSIAAQAVTGMWPEAYKQGIMSLEKIEVWIEDKHWPVRAAAIKALVPVYLSRVKQKKDVSIGKLEERLQDDHADVRSAAVHALHEILVTLASGHKKELTRVLVFFKDKIDRFIKAPLTGMRDKEVELTEENLRIGWIAVQRSSSEKDIPTCVMTESSYAILEILILAYLTKHPVLLLGPTSTGKSYLTNWLACVLGFQHLSYPINPYTSKFEIIGGIKADRKGKFVWKDGILLKAAKEGLWLVLEEINLASSEVIEILNDLLITGKLIYSEAGEQKVIVPSVEFRLFATGNPVSYAQRQVLSEVFLSRFKIHYQRALTQEELSQMISTLFSIPSALAISIAQFHTILQNQADGRIIGKKERDVYVFTLRDILRLGRRLETLLRAEIFEKEFFARIFFEIYSVYLGRIRDPFEQEALVSLLDAHFGFRTKGLNLEEIIGSQSVDALFKNMSVSKGRKFIPEQEADITPTKSQERTLCLILKALINAEHVILVGKPASGKTTLVRYLAKVLQTNLYYVNLSSDSGLEDFLGSYMQTMKGKWHYQRGLLFKVMEEGSWLLIDEANLSPLSEYLNTVLDFGYITDEEGDIHYAHPHFRLFLAMNPPTIHQSRNLLSPALRSRFTEIWVEEITAAQELSNLVETWSDLNLFK